MIRLTLMFLIAALIAGIFGFGGFEHASTEIAQNVFYVFAGLLIVSLLIGLTGYRAGPKS